MTSEELYYEFHLIFNKNASYQNVHISKGNFVLLYNREILMWLNDFIEKNSSTRRVHGIQGLLVINEKLEFVSKSDTYVSYKLPDSFFDFIDCSAVFEKNGCIVLGNNYLDSPKEISHMFANYRPSFRFEEGLCNIADDKVLVYLGDFKINEASLSYYQKPTKIDLEGYEKINGEDSTNIDSNLDDLYQSEIINRIVIEVMRQFENGNGYKLGIDRPVA